MQSSFTIWLSNKLYRNNNLNAEPNIPVSSLVNKMDLEGSSAILFFQAPCMEYQTISITFLSTFRLLMKSLNFFSGYPKSSVI